MAFRGFATAVVWVTSLAVLGCDQNPLQMVPAAGVITLDGQPLKGGQLVFYPVQGGPVATGVSDSDGRFVLRTGSRDGALAGSHRISVTWTDGTIPPMPGTPEAANAPPPPKSPVPARYATPETSQLSQEIDRAGAMDLVVALQGHGSGSR